jgi:hypothetical protein
MNLIAKIFLVTLLCCCFGCKKSPPPADPTQTINGQAFIVRADRETVKLSLLDIAVVEESETIARLNSIRDELDKAGPALREYYKARQSLPALVHFIEFQGNLLKVKKDRLANTAKLANQGNANNYASDLAALRRDIKELEDKISARVSDHSNAMFTIEQLRPKSGILEHLDDPNFIFKEPWKRVLGRTTTDADGNFTITVKSTNRLCLVAATSRTILDNTEHYGWIVPAPASTNRMFLSNNNLLDLHGGFRLEPFEPPQ